MKRSWRAFRTPSLRGAASRGPYMHAGQIKTLADVVRHYNRAPASPVGHSEIAALNLSDAEQKALVAFLKTLD
jgi:cytochrome c peroxidase